MAVSSASHATEENETKPSDDNHGQNFIRQIGWKALFGFTTRKHIPMLCAAIFVAIIAAVTLPAMAVLFGLIFRQCADYASGRISGPTLVDKASKYCVYLTAVCAVCWLANSVYFTLFLAFGELQARSARDRIFDTLLRKDIEWYDTRESGIAAILPTIQMQIRDLQLSTSVPLGEAVQCSIVGLTSLGVALYFSWNLTLVTICTIPLVYPIMSVFSTRLSRRAHEQADKLQQALKYVTSAIQNIEMVKCFNGQRSELLKYSGVISRAGDLYRRQAHFRSAQIGFMQGYTLSVFFQGFWYGSYLVTSGKVNAGDVVTTFWSALMAVQAITEFLPQLIVLQKGKVAGGRLRAIMVQTSKYDQSHNTIWGLRPDYCSGDIEFKKVSFSYPTRLEEPALDEATLFFPAGETTFVVGRSGSGKSTLGQLLMRFYDPTSGQITIDGTPLEALDKSWLRKNVTLVEQHSVLFNDTISRNIGFAKPDSMLSGTHVDKAVEFALLQQMIRELPKGLETVVGTKGDSMSGGQRQRVAIARARLRDTPVLILDETTSALDYFTRAAIIEGIRNWRRGKTTVVVTHDITQILPDDFVYILDKAKVVQEGYRKAVAAAVGSPFHTFLATESHKQSECDNLLDDNTREIVSLYAASWATEPRTANDGPFTEPLMSPIFSPNRGSIYRNSIPSIPLERRRSLANSDPGGKPLHSTVTDTRPSIPRSDVGPKTSYLRDNAPEACKVPPAVAFAAELDEKMHRSRPSSTRQTSPRRSISSSCPTSFVGVAPSQVNIQEPPRRRKHLSLDRTGQRSHYEAQETSATAAPSLGILQILKTFWPRLDWQSRLTLMAAVICAVTHAAATPSFGFVFARLLSTFYSGSDQHDLALTYALSILSIAIVDGLASYGFHFLFDACAQKWANHLKAEAFRRILLQPREFFDREENSVSRLAECLDHFAEAARDLPGRFVGIVTVVVVMITIALLWSFISCWKLTLVVLGTIPILYAILSGYNAISSRWETLSNEADENVGQVMYETFVNIRTVRCLVLEEVFRNKFTATTTAALTTGLKRAVYTGSIFGLNYSGVFFVSTLCFWFGSYLISTGEFGTTSVLQTFTILLLSANHSTFIINYIPQINIARDAGSRLIRLATLPEDSYEHKGTTQLTIAGDIVFKDTNFSYPTRKGHQVLRGVSFKIPRGSCTAIVGSSGSGKSTIAALLLKLYRTDAHSYTLKSPDLTISNHDIKTLHTATLRSRMAIVSQTPVLFPGTVAENIAYGLSPSSSHASPDSIRAAASAAGIDEFIDSLPQGYQTLIGEGGSGLSGGQAQRISIARALVREPDLLILDEATSALDVESAGIIRDTIQGLVMRGKGKGGWDPDSKSRGVWEVVKDKNMTVVIITHAREMMAIADKVVMLEKGRVVEEGGFEELKRRRGGAFGRLLRGESSEI